jgi:hypothetical protein
VSGCGNKVSIRPHADIRPEEYLAVSLDGQPVETAASPNLPVMTRGSDAACVLRPFESGRTLVPHATVAGLRGTDHSTPIAWGADDAALLLAALMDGRTLTTADRSVAAA